MSIIEEIQKLAEENSVELKEKKGVWTFKAVAAERKAFLSKKKLEYIVRFRIDDAAKTLRFNEMLKESGSGISSGSGFDGDMSPGFGFKKETYKTGAGPREGTIEEQSNLFGQKYDYSFDFKSIRDKIEAIASAQGYSLDYVLLPSRV